MTITNRKITIPCQDAPITLDQIRAVKEVVDFLQMRHRCNIWSQWWDYTTHGDLLGFYRTPGLIMLPSPKGYSAAVVVNVASGHDWVFTIKVYHGSAANPTTITLTGTGTGAPQMVQGTKLRGDYYVDTGMAPGYVTFQGDHAGDLLSVNINQTFTEDWTFPNMFEVADSGHLRGQVQRVNALAAYPQITACWCGTATGLTLGDDAFTVNFRDYHRFNDADNVLSLDSKYTTGLQTSASAKVNTARDIHVQTTQAESGSVDDIQEACEEHIYHTRRIDTTGESLATNSSVQTEIHRTAGDNTIYINGWCNYISTIPQDARLASGSGDMADADDVLLLNAGQVCDYDVISLTGDLLRNNSYYRAGQYNTYLAPKGATYALTTTLATLGYLAAYTRDVWYVDTFAKGVFRFTLSIAGVNSTGTSRTIEVKITDISTGDTYTAAPVAGTGNFYIYENCEIATQTSGHFSLLKMEIRDKNGNANVTIYSVTVQHYYDDRA